MPALSRRIDTVTLPLLGEATLTDWQVNPALAFEYWLDAQVSRAAGWRVRLHTRTTYKKHFAVWLKVLAMRNTTLLEATPADVAAYFNARDTYLLGDLEYVSRRRYLQLLDRVYKHLPSLGWCGHNPLHAEFLVERTRQLVPPKPEGLPDAHVSLVLAVIEAIPGWKGARDRAMLSLLLGAGLRVSEVIAIQRKDISATGCVHIASQGMYREHTSIVLPGYPWRRYLAEWESLRVEQDIPGELLIPGTRQGRVYTEAGIYRRGLSWLTAAGIADSVSNKGPSLFRATFARIALERYSLEEVQSFLGHEESRVTARYLAT